MFALVVQRHHLRLAGMELFMYLDSIAALEVSLFLHYELQPII